MKNVMFSTLLFFVWILFLFVGPSFGDVTYTYDASLGTLPEAQGWTSNNTAGYCSVHTDGYLNLSSTQPGMHNWRMTTAPFTYSNGVTIEATMRINSSNYMQHFFVDPPITRTGYYFGLNDDTTLSVWTAISSDRVYFHYEGENRSGESMINLLDGNFHDFLITADATGFELYIDDTRYLNEPFRTASGGSLQNFLSFGDSSNSGISNTDLKFYQVTVTPEPATTTLLLLGGGILGITGFRKSKKQ